MQANGEKYKRLLALVVFVLFLNTVIESLLLLVTDRTLIITLQLIVNACLFFRFFFFFKNIQYPKIAKLITVMALYFILLGILSSDLVLTYNYLIKFVMPLIYFMIGYNVFLFKNHFKYIVKMSWLFLSYFTVYILYANIAGIGETLYSGGIKMGYYSLNGLYIPTFCILIVLYNYALIDNKKLKLLNLLFSISSGVIIILLLKRTLIIILVFGIIVYILRNLNIQKIIRLALVIPVLLISFSYFFSDYFNKSIESRSSRFSENYDYTQEGRFTENIYIYNLMKDSPLKLLFGSGEVFNDRTSLNALRVYEDNREAHNSYIRLFWSGGILGLLMFVAFYYKQFIVTLKMYKLFKLKKITVLKNLFFFGLVFIALRFLNDFSSGITYLAYNAYSYLIIGGLLRIGKVYSEGPVLKVKPVI